MPGLQGELNFATVVASLKQSDNLIGSGVIDISGVSRADSAGLALLLELRRRANRAGKSLRIIGANAQVRGLASFFDIDTALKLEDAA
jgi:phospholipid transport system transporter-binding protein